MFASHCCFVAQRVEVQGLRPSLPAQGVPAASWPSRRLPSCGRSTSAGALATQGAAPALGGAAAILLCARRQRHLGASCGQPPAVLFRASRQEAHCDCEHIVRTVLQVPPLVSPAECALLVRAASRQAAKIGWGAVQHVNYVTEDVKVSALDDPDADNVFRSRIEEPLRERIAQGFGLPREGVQVADAFVVRYCQDGQKALAAHRDGSIVSTIVSLSGAEEYAGGGTDIDGTTYRPAQGGALVFGGARMHSGVPITAGSRYILTIFWRCQGLKQCECHYLTAAEEPLWEGSVLSRATFAVVGCVVAVALLEWQLYLWYTSSR